MNTWRTSSRPLDRCAAVVAYCGSYPAEVVVQWSNATGASAPFLTAGGILAPVQRVLTSRWFTVPVMSTSVFAGGYRIGEKIGSGRLGDIDGTDASMLLAPLAFAASSRPIRPSRTRFYTDPLLDAAAQRRCQTLNSATTPRVAPRSVVDDALPSRPPKTVYHQGDLTGGVSGHRPLSTSPDPDLGHYHLEGELYRFDIPADVYDQWILDGSIQTFNDLHLPSGQIRPEIRIMPPASGQMNHFLVPPGGG